MKGIISRLAFVSTFLVLANGQLPGARPGGAAPLGEPNANYLATINQNQQQQIHAEKSALEKRSYREEEPPMYGRPDYGKAYDNVDPCVSCCRSCCNAGNADPTDEYEYGGYGRYDDYSASSRFDPYERYNRYDPPADPTYDPYSRYDPSRYDPPVYDPPAYEPPVYDPPRYDPPVYDPPRYDPPRYEPLRNDPPKYDLRSRCGSGYNRYYDDYYLQNDDPYYYGPYDRPSNRGEFSDPRSTFVAPVSYGLGGRSHGDPAEEAQQMPQQQPPPPQQPPNFPHIPQPPFQHPTPSPPPNYPPQYPPPQYYPQNPQQQFRAA